MSDGEINVDSIDGEVSTSANIVGELYPKGEKGDKGDKGDTGFSPIIETSKVGKTTTITITDAEGTKTATILDGADGQGSGDMRTEVYDVNQDGIVDNAEKVNNHTVNSDVPANAKFTDTTYTAGTGIDITNGVITNTQISAEWGNITGTLSDQTDLKNALDSKSDTSYVDGQVGNLSNLTTTAKSNVVSAINEVDSHADTNTTNIGTLSNLTTTANTDLVSAVNELDDLKATKDVATTSANGLMSANDKNIINSLGNTYQSKILKNRNAWEGTTNVITLPEVYYGCYLIITMDPFGNASVYTFETHNGELHPHKIAGNFDTSFSISGNDLYITLSQSGYWISFALYLGNV